MIYYLFISALLGFAIVAQGIINQIIGTDRGLGFAVALNASIFFALSLIFFFLSTKFSEQSNQIANLLPMKNTFHWFYIIPGICGFLIVLGTPIAISNLGSATFFILLIASQVLTSLLYDTLILNSTVTTTKILGSLLTFIGAAIFAYSKK